MSFSNISHLLQLNGVVFHAQGFQVPLGSGLCKDLSVGEVMLGELWIPASRSLEV